MLSDESGNLLPTLSSAEPPSSILLSYMAASLAICGSVIDLIEMPLLSALVIFV